MAITKQQFEVDLKLRVTAINTASPLTLANLQIDFDEFNLNGVELKLSTIDIAKINEIRASVKAAIGTLKTIV